MAILDKILGAGEALREKVKGTFGEPALDADALDVTIEDHSALAAPAVGAHRAYAVLGLADGATLADVREAYRALARHHHPFAVRDGLDSEAQRVLDGLLEALEVLEEHLVPLVPSGSRARIERTPPLPRRKRATARKPTP
jgi:hypothetical protein